MIPKVIHYCWFGGNPLDSVALKCLESWKKYFPDYEIIQWNESNFDVTRVDFMNKAYKDKKWAFVSDVARLMVVYEQGGLYFDTDVEVVKAYDDILKEDTKAFWGFEKGCLVNSGLGFGSVKGHPFLKRLIEEYEKLDYDQYRDRIADVSCPIITTNILRWEGLVEVDKKQHICDLIIYPTTYFAPIDYKTGKMKCTKLTHSIHWYIASWQEEYTKRELEKIRKLSNIVGETIAEQIYGILSCIKKEGFLRYIYKRGKKYLIGRKGNV